MILNKINSLLYMQIGIFMFVSQITISEAWDSTKKNDQSSIEMVS